MWDYSGNGYYMVNGNSLEADTEDVTITDRGLYMENGQGMYISPPEVSQFGFVFPETFSMVAWICPIGSSTYTLMRKGTFLEIVLQPNAPQIYVNFDGQLGSSLNLPTADKWGLLSVIKETDASFQHTTKLFYNSSLGSVSTFTSLSSDSSAQQFVIASSQVLTPFKGFVLSLMIYNEKINDSDHSVGVMFEIDTDGCVYPVFSNLCIPVVSNPLLNHLGSSCLPCPHSCDIYMVCLSCHPSCDGFCFGPLDSEKCINMFILCSPGLYDSVNLQCDWTTTCTSNCAVCISSTECFSCNTGYNLQPDLTCDTNCPSGFAEVDQVCQVCHSDCSECLGITSLDCTECSDSIKILENGQCVCPEYYYADSASTCAACHSDCSECLGATSSDCTECSDSIKILENGQCVCPEYYYADSASTCAACHSDCATCTGPSSSDCSSCADPFKTIENGSCVCNEGYFSSGGLCSPCDPECKTCTGSLSTQCTSCADPEKEIQQESCTCANRFYEDIDGRCQSCDPECSTCNGPSISDCLTCSSLSKHLQSGLCVCNSGYYPDPQSSSLCLLCFQDCASCTGPLRTDCTSCSLNSNSEESCRCLEGFFLSSTEECERCEDSCKTCSGPLSTDCLKCEGDTNPDDSGRCECESGFFAKSISPLKCEPCDDSCKSCSGPFPADCLECSNPDSSPQNGCVCEVGFFLEETCKACSSDCKSCTNTEVCLECSDSRKMPANGRCECQTTYCEEDGRCLDCEAIPLATELTKEGKAGAGALGGCLALSFVSMITLEDPTVIWTITNIAQLISYLPILDLPISEGFYQFLLSYQTVGFFPNYFLGNSDNSYVPAEYQKFGYLKKEYRDTNFLKNSGRYIGFVIAVLSSFLIIHVMSCLIPTNLKMKVRKITSCWVSHILKVLLTVFLDFCIAASVFILGNPDEIQAISGLICTLISALLCTTPIALLVIASYKERVKSKDTSVTKYIGSIYSEMNLEKSCAFHHEALLSVRRLTYAATLFFYRKNPLVVLIAQLVFSVFFVLFILFRKIYRTKMKITINTLSEFVLSLTLLGLIIIYFIEETMELELAIMGINIFFILGASVSNFVVTLIEFRKKRREKQKVKTNVVKISPSNREEEVFRQSQKEIIVSPDNKNEQNDFLCPCNNFSDNTVLNPRLMIDRKKISDNVIYINDE